MPPSDLVGIVLAGGQSSRMGQDKSALTWQGKTLLQRARTLLAEAGVTCIKISGQQGAEGLPDVINNVGPMGGIHSAFEQGALSAASGFLFVPVDMPLLTAQDLQCLINEGQNHQVPVCFQNCYLPLYLPNSSSVKMRVANAISDGNLALKHLFQNDCSVQLTPTNSKNLTNVNAPADWQALQTIRSHNG